MTDIEDQCCFNEAVLTNLQDLNQRDTWSLIRLLWPQLDLNQESVRAETYGAYLGFVKRELTSFKHFEADFAIQSFASLGKVIQIVYKHRGDNRDEIVQQSKHEFLNCDETSILRSIELALRLCLTVNIRSEWITVGPAPPKHSWSNEVAPTTLLDGTIFRHSSRQIFDGAHRIDHDFTARTLMRISGVKILWTDDLAEHLEFSHKSRTLKVY